MNKNRVKYQGSRRRQHIPASRHAKWVGGSIAILLAVVTSYVSLNMGYGGDDNDLAAADHASTSQMAATIASQQRLADGDAAGASVFARQALKVSPISASALRVLGLSEQQQGHYPYASALMNQASALGWRDTPTQVWLATAYLQNNNYPETAEHIDAALRVNPTIRDFYNFVDLAAVIPAFVNRIVPRLVLNPVWRDPYFTDRIALPPASVHARALLLGALVNTPAPPARDELVIAIKRLEAAGLYQEAHHLWTIANHIKQSPVYDADFEHTQVAQAAPYEWLLLPTSGTNITPEARPGFKGMALHVTSDGVSSATLAQQTALLGEGIHHVSVKADGAVRALASFTWVVRCLPKGPVVITLGGAGSMHGASFTIPNNCPQQSIELHAQPNAASHGGEAWFGRIELQ